MARTKQKTITLKIPDQKHEEYFNAALNLVNAIRVSGKKPIISLETFAMNSLITGANEVMNWYSQEQQKAKEKEAADVEQNNNSSGQTNGESSEGAAVGGA